MNHKRKRPKHQRAGCLLCKPQKDERSAGEQKISVQRRLQVARLYAHLKRLIVEAFDE